MAMDTDMEKKGEPELNISAVEQDPVKPRGFFAKVRYYEEMLDRKLGVESHSLDRVHPENRQSPSPVVMAFMWASATMNISCFSTGFMGRQFGLSLGQTIPIVMFSTLLGAMVTVRYLFIFLLHSFFARCFFHAFSDGAKTNTPAIRAGAQLWGRGRVSAR
jgi:hypothetical protein